MMGVYDQSVKYVERYIQWPEINFKDENPISFSFLQDLDDKYEMTKA